MSVHIFRRREDLKLNPSSRKVHEYMYIMDWESDGKSRWTLNMFYWEPAAVLPLFKIRYPEINSENSWNFTKYPEILQKVPVFYINYNMLLLIPEIFLFSKCSFSILENPKKIPENSWISGEVEVTDQQGANVIDYVERSSALLEVLVLHRTLLNHSDNAFLALKIWYGVHHRLIVRRAITLNIQLCFVENQKGANAIDNVHWFSNTVESVLMPFWLSTYNMV